MRLLALTAIALILLQVPALAQTPNLGSAAEPVNRIVGQVLPPAMAAVYNATGQNITREDVRIELDMNFTKGQLNVGGLLLGSGTAEIQAHLRGRLEMRVISSERIRAAIEGENAYNVSAQNATFLSQVYVPAEVFRATATAEVVAAFQRDQEAALDAYLRRTVPEMDVLRLDFAWSNVHPYQTLGDVSLTEPPIVLELDLIVQYVRVESIPSLVSAYLDRDPKEPSPKKQAIEDMKEESGDPLRSRDFFAAAAYTQLLNLSMQPGWSLNMSMHLPRGYSFTYFNENVRQQGERDAVFRVDAASSDADVREVFLASITHRQFVAFALFVALWVAGFVLAFPIRLLYARRRVLGRRWRKTRASVAAAAPVPAPGPP